METPNNTFTHVLLGKEDGEKILAYLSQKPAGEVLTMINALTTARTVNVIEKPAEANAESTSQNQEAQ